MFDLVTYYSTAAVSCGAAPPTAHGHHQESGTTFGSTVTYRCNSGYMRSGVMTRMCKANGQWSGITPNCTGGLLDLRYTW